LTGDETYLYFSLDTDCGMADPGFVFSIGVFRWNLINGEVSEMLKASYDFDAYDGNYYSVSISPTGRRMAYIHHQNSPLALTVLDLQTGENRSFPLEKKYGSGGMFSWSGDGTKLVFMLESEKDYDHFISMVFLDLLKDDSMVTFIKDKEFGWISSRLEMTDNGIKITPYFDNPLFYDIETGILSPIKN
jgi:Tol biopolymer transport system component